MNTPGPDTPALDTPGPHTPSGRFSVPGRGHISEADRRMRVLTDMMVTVRQGELKGLVRRHEFASEEGKPSVSYGRKSSRHA